MKVGDLVTFSPEAWGSPLEDRPFGVIVEVQPCPSARPWVKVLWHSRITTDSCLIEDLEVISESR